MKPEDFLSAALLSSVAKSAGSTKKETEKVLSGALPELLGAMAKNASTEEGADSLSRALTRHSGQKEPDSADGAKILLRILGGESEETEKKVAKKSGVSRGNVSKILAAAAPLLLAALCEKKEESETRDAGLPGLLLSMLTGSRDDEEEEEKDTGLDAGDLLGGLAGLLIDTDDSGKDKKKKKKKDSGLDAGDLLGGLAGLLMDSGEDEKEKKPGKPKKPAKKPAAKKPAAKKEVSEKQKKKIRPASKK